MSALPTGTVTFLFADVEGSTKLVQSFGAVYSGVIADVRRMLREEIAANGGVEVDATGDELSAVFEEVDPALAAALAGQARIRDHTWPEGMTVKVRMGLHTGVPQLGEEGYTGLDVIRASASPQRATAGRSCSRRQQSRSPRGWRRVISVPTACRVSPIRSGSTR